MLNQPIPNPIMPDDIQKQYDNAKNILTITQADVNRLRELKNSLEGEIIEKNKQNVYVTEQLGLVMADLGYSEEVLEKLKDSIGEKQNESDQLQRENEVLEKELNTREGLCEIKESDLFSLKEELEKLGIYLEETKTRLNIREVEISEREAKIKELVAKL